MNKKGQLSLGMVVTIFIGIIVALVLIGEIATQQGISTTKSIITDEAIDITTARDNSTVIDSSVTFTVAEAPSGWKQTGCTLTSITYGNATVDFTVTTDYTVAASTGVITLVPTDLMNHSGNDTLIDYTHCRDGYNTDGGSRSIANLWTLFAALALLGFVIFGIREFMNR